VRIAGKAWHTIAHTTHPMVRMAEAPDAGTGMRTAMD
jgi:hypothetical protein